MDLAYRVSVIGNLGGYSCHLPVYFGQLRDVAETRRKLTPLTAEISMWLVCPGRNLLFLLRHCSQDLVMPNFPAFDGTVLSYRLVGRGEPLVCLAGGPGRSSKSLGELGGLSRRHQLVLLDQRGTGASGIPTDLSSLRAHAAARASQTAAAAAELFFPEEGFDVNGVRAAIRKLTAPVLVYGGAVDVMPTAARVNELAELFSHSTVTIQPEAGHHPWLDDPEFFTNSVFNFLGEI